MNNLNVSLIKFACFNFLFDTHHSLGADLVSCDCNVSIIIFIHLFLNKSFDTYIVVVEYTL